MRKIFFVLVAALWVAAGIQLIQSLNTEEEEQIVQAFKQTNCLAAEGKVTAHMKLNEYQTRTGQEQMLRDVAAQLGITGSVDVTSQTSDGRSVVELQRQAAEAKVSMSIVTIEEESDGEIMTQQYFKAEIILYDHLECALYYKDDIEDAIAEYGKEADTGLQFYGELSGSITQDRRDEMLDNLFDKISAKVCRGFENENVYTVYAYTKGVDEYERINGEKVNVTAAVTFDEQKNVTCFYLAVPVIAEDY